jgi:hypothetical protein
MVTKDIYFRRQFILGSEQISELKEWNETKISSFYLYVHPDLNKSTAHNPTQTLILLGHIFDPQSPQDNNQMIVERLLVLTSNISTLIMALKPLVGCYVLIYLDVLETFIVNDSLALREVYYCTNENQIVCASQPNLIALYAKPVIRPRSDAEFVEFYQNNSKISRWTSTSKWIGDKTYYVGVKHLLPNHYLDVNMRCVCRYWPNEPIRPLSLEQAVAKSSKFLQGSIRAIAYRHQLMMAVTAGTDSRTLLAASKGLENRIYYFINDHQLGSKHADIEIPKAIFGALGIPFHIHDVPEKVDDWFRQIYFKNTFYASDRMLATIYNIYYKMFSQKINIIGIGEIGRSRYGSKPRKLDGYRLAYKLGHKNSRYAIKEANHILAELLPVCEAYNINIMTLYYWEQTIGNWGATGNSESDIAIEEIDAFDSHLFYETLLSVDDKYTKYNNPILFREIIRKMWPELLKWPFNPPQSLSRKIAIYLEDVGLASILKEIKYRMIKIGSNANGIF